MRLAISIRDKPGGIAIAASRRRQSRALIAASISARVRRRPSAMSAGSPSMILDRASESQLASSAASMQSRRSAAKFAVNCNQGTSTSFGWHRENCSRLQSEKSWPRAVNCKWEGSVLPNAAEKIGDPRYRPNVASGCPRTPPRHRLRHRRNWSPRRQKCEKPAQERRWRNRPYEDRADI